MACATASRTQSASSPDAWVRTAPDARAITSG
jgi:hypothetical protein